MGTFLSSQVAFVLSFQNFDEAQLRGLFAGTLLRSLLVFILRCLILNSQTLEFLLPLFSFGYDG